MAKMQVITALCVIATVLVSLLVPAEAVVIDCVRSESSCKYCCAITEISSWTVTWKAGGHFGRKPSCMCTSSSGGTTQLVALDRSLY